MGKSKKKVQRKAYYLEFLLYKGGCTCVYVHVSEFYSKRNVLRLYCDVEIVMKKKSKIIN